MEGRASFDKARVSVNEEKRRVRLDTSADHLGTGEAAGMAAGAFQTAWQPPTDGVYRLTVRYNRHSSILYDRPDSGDFSGSFDTTLLALRHSDSQVLTKNTHAELQHRDGRLREELAEYVIATGTAAVVGSALGLGILGRAFLRQIVNALIDLGQYTGTGGSQIYDVRHRVSRSDRPLEMSTTFEASSEETYILEATGSLGLGFEIQDSWWYQPTSIAQFDFESLYIQRVS